VAKKLLLLIGWILFLGVFLKIGMTPLVQSFSQIGWRYIWLFLLAFAYYFSYAAGWYYIIPPDQRQNNQVTILGLFKIRLIGEAINNLTPFGSFGGEGARVYYLRKQMETPIVTASLVLDKTFYFLTAIIFVFLGVVVAFSLLQISNVLKTASLAVLLVLMLFGAMAIWLQKKGAVKKVSIFLGKRGIATATIEKVLPKISAMEVMQKEFYSKRPKDFVRVFLFHFLGRLGGSFEIWLILFLTGAFIHISLWQQFCYSLLIAGYVIVLNIVFFMFPSQIGVAEGATALLFSMLGQPPSLGVLLQLIKRIKNLFFMALGLCLMGRRKGFSPFGGRAGVNSLNER